MVYKPLGRVITVKHSIKTKDGLPGDRIILHPGATMKIHLGANGCEVTNISETPETYLLDVGGALFVQPREDSTTITGNTEYWSG